MLLESKTVSLELLSLDHLDALLPLAADNDLWTWWLAEPPNNRKSLLKFISRCVAEKEAGLRIPFAIFSKEARRFVGSTSFMLDTEGEGDIEIGTTWIAIAYHGTGLNGEMKKLMIEYAFNTLGKRRVILQTDALNLRSQKAIEKVGGRYLEKRVVDKVTWTGRIRDSIVYSIEKA